METVPTGSGHTPQGQRNHQEHTIVGQRQPDAHFLRFLREVSQLEKEFSPSLSPCSELLALRVPVRGSQ